MAGVLVELPLHLLDEYFSRPWPGPIPRIFRGELVEKRVFLGARDAFNHVQVLGSREGSQIREIGGVDYQRIAFPMADRVAQPLADVLGQMGTPIQGNEADVVDLLGFNGHVSGTLYDLKIAVVAGGKQWRSHVRTSQTTRFQWPVLRAV